MQIVICNSFGNVTTSVFVFLFFSCRHQPLRYVVVMVDPHIMLVSYTHQEHGYFVMHLHFHAVKNSPKCSIFMLS